MSDATYSGKTQTDLIALLRRSREKGQYRSRLSGTFSLDDVRVQAHQQTRPGTDLDTAAQEQGQILSWRGVNIRYRALVRTDYPKSLTKFVHRLRGLSGHPRFARLNHNKQLGTVSLAGGLGASHSRLEHTLGVLDIALMLVNRLHTYAETENWNFENLHSVERAVLVLAMFHDAFHGPYGHTMDPLRHILSPGSDEDRLDKSALRHFIRQAVAQKGSGWLYGTLQLVYEGDADTLKADLDLLNEMYVRKEDRYAFAREIVDSLVDADRLDYIPRDHLHVFLDAKVGFPVSEIVSDVKFVKDGDTPHIHFADGSLEDLKTLLLHRIFLYDHVYESREKVPYDEMLVHAAIYLLDEYGSGSPPGTRAEFEERKELFEAFVELSDQDFERVFDIVEPTPKIALAQMLLQDVRANAPFQVADLKLIPSVGIAAMWHRYQMLSSEVREEFTRLPNKLRNAYIWRAYDAVAERRQALKEIFERVTRNTVTIDVTDEEVFRALRDFSSVNISGSSGQWQVEIEKQQEEEVYWMCAILGDDVVARRRFEAQIWQRFIEAWEGYPTWQTDLCAELDNRMGGKWKDHFSSANEYEKGLKRTIDETPLVFVSCTKIPALISDLVLRNKGNEGPIRVWLEGGKQKKVPLPAERPGRSSYYAMLVAPGSLSEDAAEKLRDTWYEAVYGLDWLL